MQSAGRQVISAKRGKTQFSLAASACSFVVLGLTFHSRFDGIYQNVSFFVFSRTTVPLELRRGWTFWPNYTDVNPASTTICVDGEIGTVLKTYREVNTYTLRCPTIYLLYNNTKQYNSAHFVSVISDPSRSFTRVVRRRVASREENHGSMDDRIGQRRW